MVSRRGVTSRKPGVKEVWENEWEGGYKKSKMSEQKKQRGGQEQNGKV